jgi:hypothetical protein
MPQYLLAHLRCAPYPRSIRSNNVELGDVALDGGDVGTCRGHWGIKRGLPTASDVDVGTLLDELLCRGEANADTAAGNESNLLLSFIDIVLLLSWLSCIESMSPYAPGT